MLVVSQDSLYWAPGPTVSTTSAVAQRTRGALQNDSPFSTEKVFLGNIPLLSQPGPTCLSAHLDDAQACSTPVAQAYRGFDETEFSVAASFHVRYIDPTPWFCSNVCTAIVGPYDVYMDRFHVSATYATYLRNVLAQVLFSSTPTPTHFELQLSTNVERPSNDATLSGGYWLDAAARPGNSPVIKVDFQLSGGRLRRQSICIGNASFIGWLCHWSTTEVANGRYTLQSVAYDAAGRSVRSKPISLSVKN